MKCQLHFLTPNSRHVLWFSYSGKRSPATINQMSDINHISLCLFHGIARHTQAHSHTVSQPRTPHNTFSTSYWGVSRTFNRERAPKEKSFFLHNQTQTLLQPPHSRGIKPSGEQGAHVFESLKRMTLPVFEAAPQKPLPRSATTQKSAPQQLRTLCSRHRSEELSPERQRHE